jgi:uncharacterized protein with GYD domain
MATFVTFINWTDQGIKNIKDAPNRAEASRKLLKKLGGELKQAYLMSGEHDVMLISEAPDGEVMAKFALAVSSQGNVRTRTARAWTEAEMQKIIGALP